MRQYYYYITSLEEISIDSKKLPISPNEFLDGMVECVNPNDLVLINDLRFYFDNLNLINILNESDEEFFNYGKFSKKELEDAIKEPDLVPEYMKSFLESLKYDEREFPEYSFENELMIHFHNYLIKSENRFLSDYIAFDYALKNVGVAYNCRKYKQDALKNVLKLDELSEKLLTSKAADFGLIHDYEWLSEVMSILEDGDFEKRELKLIALRFKYMDSSLEYDYFGFNNILVYFIKLFLVERVTKFDALKGKEIFNKITDDLCSYPIDLED